MGLIGDIAGSFGLNFRDQLLNGALRLVGIDGKANNMIRLAAELSKGVSKDGFDFDKVNKGVVARNALKAFGVDSPLAAAGLTAALHVMPKGFLSGIGGAAGGLGLGAAGGLGLASLAGPALGMTAMGGLANMQFGLGGIIKGLMGAGGISTEDLAGGGMKLAMGNNTAQFRQATGLTRANYGPGSMLASLPRPAMFEDIVAAFMIDIVRDKQEKIEERLRKLEETDNKANSGGSATGQVAGAAGGARGNEATTNGNSDSRNVEFEIIKNEIQKLTQMQQAMSNVLNTMNDQAMNSIRHIKAG